MTVNSIKKFNSSSIRAFLITFSLHFLLLLLFFMYSFKMPQSIKPKTPAIDYMEISLGEEEKGSGDIASQDPEDPAPKLNKSLNKGTKDIIATRPIEQTSEEHAPPVPSVEKHNLSKVIANPSPAHAKHLSTIPAVHPVVNLPKSTVEKPKYVFQNSNGKGGNSSLHQIEGNGLGNDKDNKGAAHGKPNGSENGSGTGSLSYALEGRTIVNFPEKKAEFSESGKVTLRITVNQVGSIINFRVLSATNSELRTIALRKITQVRFNKNENSPQEQFGTLTFVFKPSN